jgi:hypothetical protein
MHVPVVFLTKQECLSSPTRNVGPKGNFCKDVMSGNRSTVSLLSYKPKKNHLWDSSHPKCLIVSYVGVMSCRVLKWKDYRSFLISTMAIERKIVGFYIWKTSSYLCLYVTEIKIENKKGNKKTDWQKSHSLFARHDPPVIFLSSGSTCKNSSLWDLPALHSYYSRSSPSSPQKHDCTSYRTAWLVRDQFTYSLGYSAEEREEREGK